MALKSRPSFVQRLTLAITCQPAGRSIIHRHSYLRKKTKNMKKILPLVNLYLFLSGKIKKNGCGGPYRDSPFEPKPENGFTPGGLHTALINPSVLLFFLLSLLHSWPSFFEITKRIEQERKKIKMGPNSSFFCVFGVPEMIFISRADLSM